MTVLLCVGFRVPHSLTLLNGDTQLMVADRENGRVVIMKTSNLSQIVSVIKSSGFGDAVFAVAAPQVSSEFRSNDCIQESCV